MYITAEYTFLPLSAPLFSLKWALKSFAVPQTECRSHLFQAWMLVLVLQFCVLADKTYSSAEVIGSDC